MKHDKAAKVAVVTSHGFPAEDSQSWYDRYYRHCFHATERGLETNLTFDQYMRKVAEAGLTDPTQIGNATGQYHLSRVEDVGNYEDGRCRFITSSANHREAWDNGRSSVDKMMAAASTPEAQRKSAETRRGRTKNTHEYLSRMSKNAGKEFVITGPDGTVYKGKNLKDFCQRHGIDRANMNNVCQGKLKQHKGYTGYWVD
jgi:hypothetical protein